MEEQAPFSLLAALDSVKGKQKPPIHLWHPELEKEIDMEVKGNGDWYYEGTIIKRQRLIHLFASVLRLEDDSEYYLITPHERCRIKVQDAPFIAILLDVDGSDETQNLTFTTNMAEVVLAGPENKLKFDIDPISAEPSPYLHVRDGLQARLHRNVYYQLADLMVIKTVAKQEWLGVWSKGVFLPLVRREESSS